MELVRNFMEREGEGSQDAMDDMMVDIGRIYVEFSREYLPDLIAPGTTKGSIPWDDYRLPNWRERWRRISARIHANKD